MHIDMKLKLYLEERKDCERKRQIESDVRRMRNSTAATGRSLDLH